MVASFRVKVALGENNLSFTKIALNKSFGQASDHKPLAARILIVCSSILVLGLGEYKINAPIALDSLIPPTTLSIANLINPISFLRITISPISIVPTFVIFELLSLNLSL